MERYRKDNPDRLARFVGHPSDLGYFPPFVGNDSAFRRAERRVAEREAAATPQS
jgi:hypothetical protein